MAEEKKDGINIKVGDDRTAAILLIFLVFWWQSGWFRIDCALGVQRACELIAAEKEYQPKAVKP